MAQRPVNLSQLIALTLPNEFPLCSNGIARFVLLRNATLRSAGYLASRGYVLMQDTAGRVWVQHEKSPAIVLPPGGFKFGVKGNLVPSSPWLRSVHTAVRLTGREALDPNVPYVLSVTRLYSGCYSAGLPWSPSEADPPAAIAGAEAQNARVPSDQVRQSFSPSLAHKRMFTLIPPKYFSIIIVQTFFH